MRTSRAMMVILAGLAGEVLGCGERGAPVTRPVAPAEPPTGKSPRLLRVGGSTLDVQLDGDVDAAIEARVVAWARRAATAVASYYGAFPGERTRIRVAVFAGRGIRHGRVTMEDLPTIHISVGRYTEPEDFEADWRLTHEMVHLAFPRVPGAHHWIEEGLATYIEPIARARIGWLTEDEVYAEWLDRMETGQPGPGDSGLDRTASWARTYWGGALFALVADVEIRRRTGNRRGLRDALRGLVRAGGRLEMAWPLERALAAADRAVGVDVLTEQYARMASAPVAVDLDGLWRDLGLGRDGRRVVVDRAAPASALRRALLFDRDDRR